MGSLLENSLNNCKKKIKSNIRPCGIHPPANNTRTMKQRQKGPWAKLSWAQRGGEYPAALTVFVQNINGQRARLHLLWLDMKASGVAFHCCDDTDRAKVSEAHSRQSDEFFMMKVLSCRHSGICSRACYLRPFEVPGQPRLRWDPVSRKTRTRGCVCATQTRSPKYFAKLQALKRRLDEHWNRWVLNTLLSRADRKNTGKHRENLSMSSPTVKWQDG